MICEGLTIDVVIFRSATTAVQLDSAEGAGRSSIYLPSGVHMLADSRIKDRVSSHAVAPPKAVLRPVSYESIPLGYSTPL